MAGGFEEGSSKPLDRQDSCPPALAALAEVPVIEWTEPHLSAKDGFPDAQ